MINANSTRLSGTRFETSTRVDVMDVIDILCLFYTLFSSLLGTDQANILIHSQLPTI